MDPLTLTILGIVDKSLSIWLLHLQAMTPEQRAAVVSDSFETVQKLQRLMDDVRDGLKNWKPVG